MTDLEKKVVSLLYLLLQRHMPFGDLEQLLRQNGEPTTADTVYVNKFILQAAQDLYERHFK